MIISSDRFLTSPINREVKAMLFKRLNFSWEQKTIWRDDLLAGYSEYVTVWIILYDSYSTVLLIPGLPYRAYIKLDNIG